RIAFQAGDLHFTGVGDVIVCVGRGSTDTFSVVAPDLKLPKGWEMDHTRRSQTYSVLLQNAPSRGAIPRLGIPDRLNLADFANTFDLRLDFCHGVRFPGGQVTDRVTLEIPLESLREVSR